MPELDGLRALAALSVMAAHFVPETHPLAKWNFASTAGVHLFFVLSGYLITSILLLSRSALPAPATNLWAVLKTFYVRRGLRIFPIYYLALTVCAIAHVQSVRDGMIWHLSYLSNVYYARLNHWYGPASHFWSLAVEEQFYLLWPWLVLTQSKQTLVHLCRVLFVIGPAYRLLAPLAGLTPLGSQILLPACSASLAIGALLAFQKRDNWQTANRRLISAAWAGIGGISLISGIALEILDASRYAGNPAELIGWALVCGVLVERSASGFRSGWGRWLRTRPLVFSGKISYGLYVYHPFLAFAAARLIRQHSITGLDQLSVRLPLLFASAFLVAAFSWILLERPLLAWRERHVPTSSR